MPPLFGGCHELIVGKLTGAVVQQCRLSERRLIDSMAPRQLRGGFEYAEAVQETLDDT